MIHFAFWTIEIFISVQFTLANPDVQIHKIFSKMYFCKRTRRNLCYIPLRSLKSFFYMHQKHNLLLESQKCINRFMFPRLLTHPSPVMRCIPFMRSIRSKYFVSLINTGLSNRPCCLSIHRHLRYLSKF